MNNNKFFFLIFFKKQESFPLHISIGADDLIQIV